MLTVEGLLGEERKDTRWEGDLKVICMPEAEC